MHGPAGGDDGDLDEVMVVEGGVPVVTGVVHMDPWAAGPKELPGGQSFGDHIHGTTISC
jgi:hypothetical protein